MSLQVNLQVHLKSNLKFHFNTDGRTDVRDEELLAADFKVTAVDAHARTAKSRVGGWL